MDMMASLAKIAALRAQCPAPAPVDAAAVAKLPIHFDTAGEGPKVVIIHGGVQGAVGGGPKTFARQKALADLGWRVAIADRPGFGQSLSRGIDDMEASAIWIADALEDGAHLIGHSWGGAAALLAAARRPEAVKSLTLVEPALQVLAITDPTCQADPAEMARVFAMLAFWLEADTSLDYAKNALSSLGRTVGDMGSTTEFDDDTLTRFGCSALQSNMSTPFALRQAAETVKAAGIPVLAVAGDWNESIAAIGELTARATGGRHVMMPSPNHFPQFENPEAFNTIVDDFMRAAG